MNFHYTVTTKQSVDEAVATLEAKLKENKFGVLWQLDLPAKLQEKGVDSYTLPYRILEVCNPAVAATVLNQNELAGYFLPCKITVFESEGQTKIGMPRPTALISMLDDKALKKTAEEIEAILIRVLDESQ